MNNIIFIVHWDGAGIIFLNNSEVFIYFIVSVTILGPYC